MSYETFKYRTTFHGGNLRDSKTNDARHILSAEFENDPSYRDSVYFWIAGVSPHKGDRVPIRMYNQRHSDANGNTVQFTTTIENTVSVGEYLYDEERDTHYICTESFNISGIQCDGKLTQCNWTLRWQNSELDILEYPCFDKNTTQYNSGESGSQYIVIGSSQHMALVQMSRDTLSIRSPMRFFVSADYSTPYKVTQNDSVSNKYGVGICNITMVHDERVPEDRSDIGICNYKEKITDTAPSVESNVKISGNNELSLYTTETYTCNLPVSRWELSNTDGNIHIQSHTDTKCVLYTEDDSLIGKNVTLSAFVDGIKYDFVIHIQNLF